MFVLTFPIHTNADLSEYGVGGVALSGCDTRVEENAIQLYVINVKSG